VVCAMALAVTNRMTRKGVKRSGCMGRERILPRGMVVVG
jgi:hypothetical protein